MPAPAMGKRPRPWESNGRVNRAGEAIRSKSLTAEDARILDLWRAAHKKILNNFQTNIRLRTRGRDIIVAQRLKRRFTIVDKLFREASMELARMDDVAGCRMIFGSIEALYDFRSDFHRARFRHKLKNAIDKYDYIKRPKSTGYRGVHDIYSYNARSPKGAVYNGLMIELQYRTKCQHAWATASELVAQVTGSEPKFGRGDPRDAEYFKLASEIISRAHEDRSSCFPDLAASELIDRLNEIEEERRIYALFSSLHVFEEIGRDAKSVILQLSDPGGLTIHEFQSDEEATRRYFELEQGDLFRNDVPKEDIVLVASDTFAQLRSAYVNYFSDAREFLRYVEAGCLALRGT